VEDDRPIGWWIRRLDTLLEEVVDRAVAADGLGRRHWQTLHSVAEGATQDAQVLGVLADFATAEDIDSVVADLLGRGWLERPSSGHLALTAEGRRAHDRLAIGIWRVRRHAADGLSQREYERTVMVLSRMVDNLVRVLGDPPS
jgi:hypothetical protein